jgi:hypothetical protein
MGAGRGGAGVVVTVRPPVAGAEIGDEVGTFEGGFVMVGYLLAVVDDSGVAAGVKSVFMETSTCR